MINNTPGVSQRTFKAHSRKQEDAIFSETPITLLATGIQFGKTTAGAWWMKRLMHKHVDKSDVFLVVAPTYKILKQSTLPPFLKIMDSWGEMNQALMSFHMYNGGTCFFRTNTEPDSIVGLTNVRGIWGDEAGKFTLYFWENIQGRASFKKAPVMLTTSPYSLNWVYRDLLKPYHRGQRTDLKVIEASSKDNPYFPVEEFERKEKTMDVRRFQAMYGGKFSRMTGLVYDCWDDDLNLIDSFELPNGTQYYAGVDWGYTDPFVIKVRAVTPDGRHYGVSEFYKSKLSPSEQITMAKQLRTIWKIKLFYADPSQPGMIDEFNKNGLPTTGANNDMKLGISLHYELVKTRRYKEFRGSCPFSMDERENYHYPEPQDLKPDQDKRDDSPVDQSNHAMDVDRYITASTFDVHTRSPRLVQEVERPIEMMNNIERLEFLKNKWKKKKRYEEWL